MARQIDVIDLTGKNESCQDKDNKLEATVENLGKKLYSLTELVVALTDARNPMHNVPSSGPSAHVAPIYTVAPPTMHVTPPFGCDAQKFPNLHAFLLEKEFGGFSKTSSEKSNEERFSRTRENNGTMTYGSALASQAGLGGAEKGNVSALAVADPPVDDGTGNPLDHLKAFNEWIAIFGKSNGIKLRLFVKTLAGPALTWFATQDLGKRFTWDELACNFVKQHELSNSTLAKCIPPKRKSVELEEEAVATPLSSDKRACGLVETQSKAKGKAVMPNPLPTISVEPSAIKQAVVDPSSRSSTKRSAFAFTRLPESYASLFERLKRFNLVYPIKSKPYWSHKSENYGKFCVYHSGMQGHHIEECILFKKEVESLINSGQVKILPTNGIGEPFVAILPYAKGNSSKKAI